MKRENMQKNFIEKLVSIRKLIDMRLSELDSRNLVKIMSKLAHYHYNKKKYFIIGDERKLYNLLITNSYNPYTVYRWFLLERIPEDIKFQIKQSKISQKKAISEAFVRRNEGFTELTASVREFGLSLIARM